MTLEEQQNQQQGTRNEQFAAWTKRVIAEFKARGFTVASKMWGGYTGGPFTVPNYLKYTLSKAGTADWPDVLMHLHMDEFADPARMVDQGLNRWSFVQSYASGIATPAPVGSVRDTVEGVAPTVGTPRPVTSTPGTPPVATEPAVPFTPPVVTPTPPPGSLAGQQPTPPADKLTVVERMNQSSKTGRETWDGWGYYYRQVTGRAAPSPGSVGIARVVDMPAMRAEEWWGLAFETPAVGDEWPGPGPGPVTVPGLPGPAPGNILASMWAWIVNLFRSIWEAIQSLFAGAKPPEEGIANHGFGNIVAQ